MKKRFTSIFAKATIALLLAILALPTEAWADGLSGSGTKDNPWMINNVDDWSTFTGSTTYWASGTFVKLNADITITSSAGTSGNKYQGTFDGYGHTLTLNLTHTGGGDAFIAPFRFIYGATIKRLHTIGTITTDGKMAGGIVGDSHGTSTIQSCWSSVTINTSISGDGTHGGLVGRVEAGTLTITDCLFDGIITYTGTSETKTDCCGGFVGWKSASLNLNHCLQAGDLTGISGNGGATFCRFNSGSVDFSTCYYRTTYGTGDESKPDQGTQTTKTGNDLKNDLGDGWTVSGTDAVPIISVNPKDLSEATISGLKPHYKYTGSEITVTYTVKDAADNTLTENTDYTVAISPAPVQQLGNYTLTITAMNNNATGYFGSKNVSFQVLPWAEDAVAGGYCGDPTVNNGKNVYYEITGDGDEKTITFHGTGAMEDYEDSYYLPWKNYRGSIKYAVIDNGVATIGNKAFYDCDALTSVTIPNSVTTIGVNAFYDCDALTSITIPNSVTTIGDYAFDSCDNLGSLAFDANSQLTTIGSEAFCYCYKIESITIPNSVTIIGDYAFWGCSELASATIGSGVSTLGLGAFSNCDVLTTITVDANNNAFKVVDGVLFSKDETTLVAYPKGLTDIEYSIPNGVTTICGYAFYNCSALATINNLASVTTIGEYAFYGTTWLNNQTYEDGVLYINNVAIASSGVSGAITIKPGTVAIAGGCFYNSDITSVTIPTSVTSIGNEAFYDCDDLESVTFENGSQLKTIGDYAFYDCNITSITIPASVSSIGKGAFYDCYYLKTVTFENGSHLTTIGDYAFYYCYEYLTSITIPASVTTLGEGAFEYCEALKSVNFEENSQLKTIGDHAFYYCDYLANINIPNGVTSIGDYAFDDCNITSITIPASVTTLGEGAFEYCCYLKTVTFEENSQLKTIGDYAFYDCNITSITIPASVTNIGKDAFRYCSNITDVYCYADPTKLTWDDGNCNDFNYSDSQSYTKTVCHVENAADWSSFASKVNVTFVGGYCGNTAVNDGKNLRWDITADASRNKTLKILKNPNAVGTDFSMTDDMDFGSKDFKGVTIENGVTSIGANAFKDFTGITSVTIPASMTSIGASAFNGCSNLNSVVVLAMVPPTLGGNAFKDIVNDAEFTVRNDDYMTANGWKDVKDHTGDYSYVGCAFTMNVPDANNFNIAYIDANGQPAVCPIAFPITDSDQDKDINYSGDTWYYVSGNVTINGELKFSSSTASTNLILCDGAKLTVNNIYAANNLNIYQQEMDKGIGAIAISYDDASKSISAGKDITINGGNITIENTKIDSYGIYTDYNVTINGGIINVTSQKMGIEGYEYLTVNGGTINVNNADYGLYSDDYLTINGGVINVNNANYGLYAYDYSLTITGGEITITDAYYYGIYSVYEAINISGGTVTIANTDYGIYTYDGDSEINISGGTVTIDNAYYGIYTYYDDSEINISGGTVTIANTDYGIYTYDEYSKINISGGTVTIDYTDYGIYTYDSGSDITISGGKVNVNATNYGIYSYHDFTINGGEVTVNATGDPSYGIYAYYSVVISGGKVVANGTSYGIYGYDDITLGYGSFGDYIYASNYDYTSSSGAVNIVNGKSFIYDNGNGSFETVSGDNVDKVAIAGKYLFPVINNINIAANQAPDGNYWTTFYTSPKTYKIDDNENAYAYTASNSGTNLTLHKLGKVIPAGTAVVIVGEDNSISMTASTEDAEEPNALTGNDLKGVDVRTKKSTLGTGTFYVLSKKNTDFGFFQYTADYMPANKAYLLLNSNAPSLTMMFEETTGIASMPDVRSKKSDVWYTLDGRKLDEKPTAKGLYIVNGRKVVIK